MKAEYDKLGHILWSETIPAIWKQLITNTYLKGKQIIEESYVSTFDMQ